MNTRPTAKPGYFCFGWDATINDIINELEYEGMTTKNITDIESLDTGEIKVSFMMVC